MLTTAIENYQSACVHDRVSEEDQALAKIRDLVGATLPDHVESLRDLETFSREFRHNERTSLKAMKSVKPAAPPPGWFAAFKKATERKGLSTPVQIARACDLAVPTVQAILDTREPPGAVLRETIESALGFSV